MHSLIDSILFIKIHLLTKVLVYEMQSLNVIP